MEMEKVFGVANNVDFTVNIEFDPTVKGKGYP